MSRYLTRFAPATLAVFALAVGASVIVSVNADVDTADATPSAASTRGPKLKPKVTGTKNRWGATIGATTSQGGRLHPKKNPGTSNPPRSAKKTTPIKNTKPRRLAGAQDEERRPFRLNIGMCGQMQPDGSVPGPARCLPDVPVETVSRRTVPPQVVRPRPQDVTWEQVLAETKLVGFPGLAVKVQPKGRTLVNLDTIVYTDESKVSTTPVTLLGFPVIVQATPISYTWNFGDGTPALTTSSPGKPYPAKEIVHKYLQRGRVNLTLTTNYAARFNVADTGWQYIDGTIPVTGPATALQVREAVPVLVDPPN